VTVSFWLEDAGDDPSPRPPLDGDVEVDVAIAGAGFTGLWTARELLRRDPALRVLICEAETAGFGASGRNGAWLTSGLGVGPTELARRTSPETARATVEAMRETIDLVAASVQEDGIDAQLRRGGILRLARGRHELPALERAATELAGLGLESGIAVLDAAELAERVRVSDAHGALADAHAAAIHPGRLVRGLARRVEALGATIAEGTPVRRVVPRSGTHRPRLETDRGTVTADAVVLACEAWQSQLPGYERSVLPVYSLIVLTEPLDEATWQAIGWDGHELLSSHRYTVDYLSRTPDGRVLFGGRGAPYHFRSRIDPRFDRHAATHALLRAQLADWFPQLATTAISHEWGGPLGMPRDWLPSFAFDPATGVGGAFGYTGQGVAATNLAGRVLADLIVHGRTPYEQLPMVGHRPRRWEPEPLRWMGARYLQVALARLDARSARTGRPPTGRSLAERLVRH
jgi:glycine/D-amino acid oxidase-like deaminating enzyme